ncbi:hypothetical protein [Halomonas sp. PBN3]|uniref:hypothetical protein n=1 Tax=Halomonas sp. PBN3 TaxID=1397528 RepID=UPI0003B87531|nr:hypothetical protein [Halomonas sp. PBN3]ERS88839.1 hypothetical protein Q671_07970 [Halomonas sp. PBN3]
MTDTFTATAMAHRRQALRDAEQELIEMRGIVVDLACCTPAMREAVLAYASPALRGDNPLARIEAAEDEHTDRAVAELAVALVAQGRDEDAIEDALVSLREHLAEHFRQRKLARLYDGR